MGSDACLFLVCERAPDLVLLRSQFLESLCDYLYDSLRPRILHEPKLEALCELCTVLSAMMALDTENSADDDDDDDERVGTNDSASPAAPLGRLRFSVLLQTIQQDTQTRLVFRAQAVIQSEVLHFVPSADDLAYPDKLEAHKDGALALWTEDERLRESEVGGFRVPREEVQETWYPTLKRTVYVLSKLNTYVNVSRVVFLPLTSADQCLTGRRTPSLRTLPAKLSRSAVNRCPLPQTKLQHGRPKPKRMASCF